MPTSDALAAGPTLRDPSSARRDRFVTGVITAVPAVLVVAAGFWAWGGLLHWQDLVVFGVMYGLTGLGVTVGFHRLLTHRAFETHPWMRGLFAILGSAALEGPVIEWVAHHRKHHAFSDEEGDPHSPHVGHGDGWRGAMRGLFHAHLGWVFSNPYEAEKRRYTRDLLDDPVIAWVDRTFLVWAVATFLVPFGLGFALTGTLVGGLTGMLWGGAVRLFFLHHVTFSINSLCHFFGRRPYRTGDESRNLAWLALPSFGEAWHNNHHAFPTSARHGLRWWQVDVSALVIAGLAKAGLAWNVVGVREERERALRTPPVAQPQPGGASPS